MSHSFAELPKEIVTSHILPNLSATDTYHLSMINKSYHTALKETVSKQSTKLVRIERDCYDYIALHTGYEGKLILDEDERKYEREEEEEEGEEVEELASIENPRKKFLGNTIQDLQKAGIDLIAVSNGYNEYYSRKATGNEIEMMEALTKKIKNVFALYKLNSSTTKNLLQAIDYCSIQSENFSRSFAYGIHPQYINYIHMDAENG